MLNRSDSPNPAAQAMSSLMDGDLTRDAVGQACALWRRDPESRQRWHAYQLIGDVLRSEDLANAPARDEAFLQALRQRLAQEPVPMAPQPLAEAPALQDIGQAVANGMPTPRRRRLWPRVLSPWLA